MELSTLVSASPNRPSSSLPAPFAAPPSSDAARDYGSGVLEQRLRLCLHRVESKTWRAVRPRRKHHAVAGTFLLAQMPLRGFLGGEVRPSFGEGMETGGTTIYLHINPPPSILIEGC